MEKSLLLAKSLLQTLAFHFKMNKNVASILALIALVVLFNGLIPLVGNVGLNYFIMSVASIGSAILIHQPTINNRLFWWAYFGSIASGINVSYDADAWALQMYLLSHTILIGALHSKNVQNLFVALFQWIILSAAQPFYFLRFLFDAQNWPKFPKNSQMKKAARILIIPALLSIVFIILYSQANSDFYSLVSVPLMQLVDYISSMADGQMIFSSLIACFFLVPLLIPITIDNLRLKFAKRNRFMSRRVKYAKNNLNLTFSTIGLKHELQIASNTLLILNVLVLLFNILDIVNVWFNYSARTAAELSEYVHNGTYVTILSTLTGSLIIAIFFRGNLNFLKDNRMLKLLASIWLFQNVFLVASTALRNYRYVEAYGLTEKRLGVMIFLAMTLLGILFTYQKIHNKYQLMHLFNQFSLSAYLIILAYSMIDHPATIVHYAANYQKEIDANYISKIAWKRDALLDRYKEKLNTKIAQNAFIAIENQYFSKNTEQPWIFNSWVKKTNNKLGHRIRLQNRHEY